MGTFKLPHVSLIDNSKEVKYDQRPFKFDPRYLYEDLTASTTLDTTKRVIGIEVIPANHMPDRKARFMSVKNMSKTDPENGCTDTGNNQDNPAAKIPWGSHGDNVKELNDYVDSFYQLKCDSSIVTEKNPFGILNELDTTAHGGCFVTDYNTEYQDTDFPYFDGAYLVVKQIGTGSPSVYSDVCPYPFNPDGTRCLLYNGPLQSGNAISDMNGKDNTLKLVNNINVSEWQTGDLNTTIREGNSSNNLHVINYPAAAACYRFNAGVPSLSHQWYLPAAGELGYVAASISKINKKIESLPANVGVKLGIKNVIENTSDNLGSNLWSSTEMSANISWKLSLAGWTLPYLSDFFDSYERKYYGRNDDRVRAFIALKV